MKKFIQNLLAFLTRKILAKYKPKIIGITGSVGKTSTKEAVFSVLAPYFYARRNLKNYNNEIGLPLTVIGAESGGHSVLRWFGILLRGFAIWLLPVKYPEILILEMGADHPGDIKYLTDMVRPSIGIVTAVAPVHTEFFGTVEKVAEEKSILIKVLPKDGVAILNYDDPRVRAMREKSVCRAVAYGFEAMADVRAIESAVSFHALGVPGHDMGGIHFKLSQGQNAIPVYLTGVLGRQQVYSALAAASVGLALGLNPIQISEALRGYHPPAGRMNLLSGIKGTTIIDDTYNASPVSVGAALDVFKILPKNEETKFYACLGDMLELGKDSVQMHREIGWKVAEIGADVLIACGALAKDIAVGAREGGMGESQVFHFAKPGEAGKFLQEKIKSGDVVLIKGSQGIRMEKAVKEIMAEPMKAGELLVRQGPEWLG